MAGAAVRGWPADVLSAAYLPELAPLTALL